MKKNETNNTQAQAEVKEVAPKATKKATKAESIKLETGATGTGATKAETATATKPETKAAATAAAPSSPEPPTPTPNACTKPAEEKVEEQQQPQVPQRTIFRLSKSIQIEMIPVWGTGLWSIADGITTICLSEYTFNKVMRVIERNPDYKEIIKTINDSMKMERFNKHARHGIERELIKEMGGHTHTHRIRRFFI